MEEKYIDLHVHSTGSDGTYTPTQLVQLAKEQGLGALALTDHDSVNGIAEALEAGEQRGVEVVPGIELSTEYEGCEIHVVGLYIDPTDEQLIQEIRKFVDNRDNRNLKMIDKLREHGFDIDAERIYAKNPDSVIARPHIARHLVETGQVRDMQTVFDKYIGDGCSCYVDRYKISPMRAVELIHGANGLAFLAHPCLYDLKRKDLIQLINCMCEAGLDGIEAIYSCNQGSDETDFRALADQFELLISGGSDFHGTNKPYIHLGTGKGNLKVPYSVLQQIKDRIGA